MKTFALIRIEDISGRSGTGKVAQGVIFDDNTVAMRWLTGKRNSTAIFNCIEDVKEIHGHNGRTIIQIY
jgi:hypothetical protein